MALSIKQQLQNRTWTKGSYLISTDRTLLPIQKLQEVFASDELYWAKPLPAEAMREMLESSLCFGLYEQSQSDETTSSSPPQFIGIARCITDYVTFIYLTDVWVDPKYQGQGLGTWLLKSIQEVIEAMPYLRRSLLFTGDWERSVPFYERVMGMEVMQGGNGEGLAVMGRKGKGHSSYVEDEN
ncbi:hypothetical protein NW759_011184 [Fusarium solani]|jgi:ribosomal protein S18 acetylase RimI-like enzyme|uniref:N-acetyltransferase domain-containing protein n=1 Tax=Fusarium solani TaxID=169388 RepID=A0A9P9HD66_FUSSL|nr:uncharacterized protein B0J15DRAFT_494835 [Fusarium solani]KAH7254753.1 hypothetical protein B0J15DRAFT_494835 [Fusarium solani]KAJ4213342.1 hypothetical protein NW759_011184 [Fusarium solani]